MTHPDQPEAWREAYEAKFPPPAKRLSQIDARGRECHKDGFRDGFLAASKGEGEGAPEGWVLVKEGHHRFGSPPRPVANPSEEWCDAYAAWYNQE
jgi:hypothetical protein